MLVTGGAGRVGKAATQRLVQNGWDVRVIGLEDGIDVPGVEFIKCDIMDYDAVREQMRGCQAVVHLAAIASPSLAVNHKVFDANASGTFHVFEAAAVEGIRKIAHASSINALGCSYNLVDINPRYFPVDEAHPTYTTDSYSFAKGVVEQIGEYYWRRDGISSVALRFPAVVAQDTTKSEAYGERRRNAHRILDELAALPPAESRAKIADVKKRVLDYRKGRPLEYKDGNPNAYQRRYSEEPLWGIFAFDRFNYWAVVDERDSAQALEKGITADYEGAHTLFINDDHNHLCYDSKTLVRLFFPEVNESDIRVTGTNSLVSIEKARKLIGYEPEHSVVHWQG
ncbi:MAG: NAD(P)-dependent oxidoreductase [Anaerolineae bacterium]|nr:NAD(P)-dependent oxidoreductase [Anaerolineae bacterium]